jgi:hypothetical protein
MRACIASAGGRLRDVLCVLCAPQEALRTLLLVATRVKSLLTVMTARPPARAPLLASTQGKGIGDISQIIGQGQVRARALAGVCPLLARLLARSRSLYRVSKHSTMHSRQRNSLDCAVVRSFTMCACVYVLCRSGAPSAPSLFRSTTAST